MSQQVHNDQYDHRDEGGAAEYDEHEHDDHHDHHDDGGSLCWTFSILVCSLAFFWKGQWKIGIMSILMGICMHYSPNLLFQKRLSKKDQYMIKYDNVNYSAPQDVLHDLETILLLEQQRQTNNNSLDNNEHRSACLAALACLPKKYNSNLFSEKKNHHLRDRMMETTTTQKITTDRDDDSSREDNKKKNINQLAISCLQVASHCLETYGDNNNEVEDGSSSSNNNNNRNDDEIVSGSVALLALVAKNNAVRDALLLLPPSTRRQEQVVGTVNDDDDERTSVSLGLDQVIRYIRKAMERAKEYQEVRQERRAAELQRRACLLLGALSDDSSSSSTANTDNADDSKKVGNNAAAAAAATTTTDNNEMAVAVVQKGGLQSILDATSWYRFHVEVACWGLWAIFILLSDSLANKFVFVELDGIPIVLDTMKHHCCFDSDDDDDDTRITSSEKKRSLEVTRHGIAILFDLLRSEHSRNDNDSQQGSGGGSSSPRRSIGSTTNESPPALDVWRMRNAALAAGLHDVVLACLTNFVGPNTMDIYLMGRELLVGTGYGGEIPEPQIL